MTPLSDTDCLAQIRECAQRLHFKEIEVAYIIGRARTRDKDPWDTAKIAAKLGITEECVTTYERIMAAQAQQSNPMLHSLIARRTEIDQKVDAAIDTERQRRDDIVGKLADDWLDPGTIPIMRKTP